MLLAKRIVNLMLKLNVRANFAARRRVHFHVSTLLARGSCGRRRVRRILRCHFRSSDRSLFRDTELSNYRTFSVAFLDIALRAAVILLTVGSALGMLCRCTIQLGSLYESHVAPDASSQTSAFNGRSIPTVCTVCINGVPPRALPKMMSSVGLNSRPASPAPAA